jgi:rod shape-determining protein MreC
MDTFMGRYRNVTILAAAIFLQILGLAIQIKRSTENESSRLIRLWAVSVVAPLEKGIVRVQSSAVGVWHNYFYLRGVRQENRDLRDQLEQLRLEQVRLKQDADQAHRLQALLGFKEQFVGATAAAQVIGSSGSEQSRLVYIDKGSDDGIRNEMPVITADGVVGKVLSVIDGSTSQVLLISDQQSGVGAILEQSRLQGVLKGRASGELVIDKIMTDEEVKPGDRILTSGGDRIFPKGLPVGTVSKISKGAEFLQVTVKPAAMLTHLEEVLVITKKEQREAPASTAAPTRAADILAQRLPSVPDKPATSAPGTAAPTTASVGITPSTTDVATTPVKKPAPLSVSGAAEQPLASSTAQTKPASSETPLAAKPAATPPQTTTSPDQPRLAPKSGAAQTKPASSEAPLAAKPAANAPPQTTTSPVQPKLGPKPGAATPSKPATDTKTATPEPNPSGDTPQ